MPHDTDSPNGNAAGDVTSGNPDASVNPASAEGCSCASDCEADATDAAADAGVCDSGNTIPFPDATANALAAENAKLREAAARALADLENYRRRAAREKEELRKYANQGILEDLIPVIDNFGMGLDAAAKHAEAAPVVSGFKMILTQIKNLLEQNGLVEINPAGLPFDPNFHESVGLAPHETIPDHNVANVLRVGYRLQDRLVRPASVILSTGPAKPAAAPVPAEADNEASVATAAAAGAADATAPGESSANA